MERKGIFNRLQTWLSTYPNILNIYFKNIIYYKYKAFSFSLSDLSNL